MIVFLSFFSGACPAVYSELLPTRVRYTALSIGYNIAVAVFGGFAPFIATWLIGVTGSNLAPSYYLTRRRRSRSSSCSESPRRRSGLCADLLVSGLLFAAVHESACGTSRHFAAMPKFRRYWR
jgi:hypothetical protein